MAQPRVAIPVQPPDERRAAAIHEAGHAVAATLFLGPGAVDAIDVAGEPGQGGRTEIALAIRGWQAPTLSALRALVRMRYGGLVAEELVHGQDALTVGAAHDIAQATEILCRLVGECGASTGLGPILVSDEGRVALDEGTRAGFWAEVRSEARAALADTRAALVPHVAAIETLAGLVLATGTGRLAGPALNEVLDSVAAPTKRTGRRPSTMPATTSGPAVCAQPGRGSRGSWRTRHTSNVLMHRRRDR